MEQYVVNEYAETAFKAQIDAIKSTYQAFLATHPNASHLQFYQAEFDQASEDYFLATGKRSLNKLQMTTTVGMKWC